MEREQLVYESLKALGVSPRYKGYRALMHAILVVYENPDSRMSKDVYPEVAKRVGSTVSAVERSIRHVIEVALPKAPTIVLLDYFGDVTNVHQRRMSNGMFVFGVAEYIRRNED